MVLILIDILVLMDFATGFPETPWKSELRFTPQNLIGFLGGQILSAEDLRRGFWKPHDFFDGLAKYVWPITPPITPKSPNPTEYRNTDRIRYATGPPSYPFMNS